MHFDTSTVIWHKNFMCKFAKMLQLLGDQDPQTLYRGFAAGPHWGTEVPQTPGRGPPLCKILNTPLPVKCHPDRMNTDLTQLQTI